MHQAFSDWLKIVSVDPAAPSAKKHWPAVERYVSNLTRKDILPLVRLAAGLPSPPCVASLPGFAQAFKMPVRPHAAVATLEHRILAGAVLVHRFDSSSDNLSDLAALAMVCVRCWGRAPGKMIPDFTGFAESYLKERCVAVRRLGKLEPVSAKVECLEAAIKTLGGYVAKFQQDTVNSDEIKTLVTALKQSQAELRLADPSSTVEANQRLLLEQVGILWWLVSSFHLDDGTETPEDALLRVARELAVLVLITPAPVYIKPVLAKRLAVLPGDREEPRRSLDQYVGGVGEQELARWRLEGVPKDALEFCPVARMLCGMTSEETPDAGVERNLPISFTRLELVHQICQELILVRMTSKNDY